MSPSAGGMRRALRPALLFAGAAALSAITALDGIQPNDEGVMLQAAARIADGQVPYEDFWFFYPPGQPYLLGGLWDLFGPSLLTWRIVRVVSDATVALLVFALARRGGATPGLALAAWLAAALAMAYPTGPHPFPLTLAFALGALLLFDRRPLAAGILAGLCAAWRIEFAAYLGLGVLLAYAIRPGPRPERAALAARFAGAAAAVAALLYVPVVAAAGVGDAWEHLVRFPIEDFGPYQSLPFPFDYDGPLNTGSIGGFLDDSAEPLLLFYLPLALMLGLAGAVGALGLRFTRERWRQVATVVFAAGMAHYLLARPDLFHTAPLTVMVALLAAWALSAGAPETRGEAAADETRGRLAVLGAGARGPRPVAFAAGVLAAATLAYAAVEGLDRRWLELRADYAELRLPVADGVRAGASERDELESAVNYVRERVPPGQPLYVATLRSDLASAGNPLFYVLADRHNPTRYDIQQAGVITSAPVQRELVADLERAEPRLVVRYTSPTTARREPNRSGESSGVRLLDKYLAQQYRRAARFGEYLILERRGS